ncbi:hypothetical protein MW7_006155 [Imbroritus primus]|uniref:Uncharacterized protein n=1 Tax=Imbroritus primus TaxID=3058603 RepID=A0ACD3SQR1_9BURK|nr:hypothetical protein MW7_006155 [Burkholderiaceae bacterium PBA]
MHSAPVLVSAAWFRRGCALLAAGEGAVLGWLALQSTLAGPVPGWLAGLLSVALLMLAWPPLWRSANICKLAFVESAAVPTLQVWHRGTPQPVPLPLRWCWWWSGRLVLLGLGQGRATVWVLIDAGGASAVQMAGFHRRLRDATSAQPEAGARW